MSIQGRAASGMDLAEVRSLINFNARSGLSLTIRRADGRTEAIVVKEGPVYPLAHERVELPRP